MEANENGLQDLQQNEETPNKGAKTGFFSWLRVHIFNWWMRLLILFLLVVPLWIACIGSVWSAVGLGFDHPPFELIFLIGVVLLLLLAVNGILSIVDLCKRHIKQGAIGLIGTILLSWIALYVTIGSLFLVLLDEEDHFADNLKLPEGIELTEPLKPEEYFAVHSSEKIPEDSFQYQVIAAANSEKGLDKKAVCRVPALEKLSSMPDGRERLIRYLNDSPEWDVYEDRCGLYAARCFETDGKNVYGSMHYYYRNDYADWTWQYRLGIGLDGRSWYLSEKVNKTRFSVSEIGLHQAFSIYSNGKFVLDIFEANKTTNRPMTAKTLELLEKEFSVLLSEDTEQWAKTIASDENIRKNSQPDIILYNGSQGGIYHADIWCNPGEPGLLYLKAFEITRETRLSERRMPKVKAGYSSDPSEMFLREIDFTIYEGNWEQYYGARFEVWFKPDSDQPDRKLFEKNFKIEGWQR